MYMQTVTRHSSSKDSTRLSFQMPSATSANRPDEVGPGDVEATLPGAVGVATPHDHADDRQHVGHGCDEADLGVAEAVGESLDDGGGEEGQ